MNSDRRKTFCVSKSNIPLKNSNKSLQMTKNKENMQNFKLSKLMSKAEICLPWISNSDDFSSQSANKVDTLIHPGKSWYWNSC